MEPMERGAYVRMMSAVYAAMFLIRLAFGITLVTFARYIDATDFVYSLVVSTAPMLELVTVVFAGVLIDRYGRKGVLLTGLALGAVSLYGLALTRNVFFLGAINGIHGIAAAFILVTTLAIIATYAPTERRGREMGLFNLANIFGWIAGFVVGFLLLDVFCNDRGVCDGLEYTFILSGLLATAGLLYANRMIQLPTHERKLTPTEGAPSLSELLASVGNRNILLLTAPWLIVFMLIGAFITFLPRVTGSSLQISGGSTALGILAVGLLLLVSQYFWGRLADRHGRETIMLVGSIGFALLMGIIVFAFFETGPILETVADSSFEVTEPAAAVASMSIMAAAPMPSEPEPEAPVVGEIEPEQAPPGTNVTITGQHLHLVEGVRLNGRFVPFDVVSDTRLVFTVPDSAQSGPLVLLSPTPPGAIFQNVMSHWFLLAVALFVALAFAPAGLAAIADEAKEGAQGTTMSAYSLTLSLGFILGPPVVGAISERWGGQGMILYYATLAAGLLALVLTRFIQTRVTKTLPPIEETGL